MFKNYFKISLRNLWKNKAFSAINIIGLAIGLATCLMIMLFVIDELSYDAFNTRADRIYRVDSDIQFGGNHFILAVSPDPLGKILKQDYPQVEQYVRFRSYGGLLIKKGNTNLHENRVIYTDATLFDVFTLNMIDGNPKTALTEPHSMVITESTAMKYFNKAHVAGQTLLVNDKTLYKITGVIKDIPEQSHFKFNFFVSLSESNESRKNNWLSNNFNTYIVLKPGADPKSLEAQFDKIVETYTVPQAKDVMNISFEEFKKSGNHVGYSLTPLKDIHLHSNKTAELGINGNIQYVYIFSAIAFFILLIACVNFMNLSTARSSNRAKEVGVRKVLGSLRRDLISQFLTESVLLSVIALILAVLLTWIMLPYFNQLASKHIDLNLFAMPWLLPVLIALVILVGLIAGSYPAFYLSAFEPIIVLKGKLAGGFKRSWLRSGLVVFQFAISIFLIIATVVIYSQLNYIRSKELGFNRQQMLVIYNTQALGKQAKSLKDELVNIPGVQNATMTGYLPTGDSREDGPLFTDASLDQKTAVSLQKWDVDDKYIPTLGMQIVKGRNFSSQLLTDSSGIIINEAAARLFGFKDPINQPIYNLTSLESKEVKTYHIIGVVKNFNFNSLREEVTPLALFLGEEATSIALKINTANIQALIAQIESKFKTYTATQPFNYSFMDDDFDNIYKADQRVGKISICFSVLAILIACLGLFGLITYAAEQRMKEIGIRKVLGANISNIISLLSKDLLSLVIIAALFAFPFAGWAMSKWLQSYAYRIDISWWVFAIAGITAIIIALVTIGFQALKAAIANPIKSLRTE